jgi:hypothetical protein
MVREQHEGDIANVVAHRSIGVFQLQRNFLMLKRIWDLYGWLCVLL